MCAGNENFLLHDVRIRLAGCAFQCASDDRETIRGVVESGARFEQQAIACEDGEAVRELRVVMSVIDLAFFVVADAREVSEELASCDGPLLFRKRRAVFLDRSVKVEFAFIDQVAAPRRPSSIWRSTRCGTKFREWPADSFSRSALPKAFWYCIWPFTATATEIAGIRCSVMVRARSASMRVAVSVEIVCAAVRRAMKMTIANRREVVRRDMETSLSETIHSELV